MSCSQPLPTSEPSHERPDVGRGTEWGRTWVSTSADSLSILNLFIDFLYCKESKLRAWEAAIHVLLITGVCEGEPELSGSSHFHLRQSVYPHVVYSVHQLATTQVMFTTRCSLVPRLSPHRNKVGQESENEATKYILGGYCKSEPDSRQSVYPCFVLVCTTPASSGNKKRSTAGLFTFLYFRFKTSKFLYNRSHLHATRCSLVPRKQSIENEQVIISLSSGNNLLMFRLNVPVIIRAKMKKLFLSSSWYQISFLFIYAGANWEAIESIEKLCGGWRM